MLCPACAHENIAGVDRCEFCMAPLAKLDVPQPRGEMQRRLMEDPISRLAPAPAVHIPGNTTVAEAVRLMKAHKMGCLLVTEGLHVTGIFSERDVLNKLTAKDCDLFQVLVREVMTAKPIIFNPDDSIRYVIHEMSVGGFRHIPVVNQHIPVGIISVRDVLGYLCQVIDGLKQGKTSAAAGLDHSQS
ncbi:MAG: CBS domain-containing protein [Terriglobia bacterium]